MSEGNPNIRVEITDALEFHCFRIVLEAAVATPDGERAPLELMFHARQLVDLIHKANVALCEWQVQTTGHLLEMMAAPNLVRDPAMFNQFLDALRDGGRQLTREGTVVLGVDPEHSPDESVTFHVDPEKGVVVWHDREQKP